MSRVYSPINSPRTISRLWVMISILFTAFLVMGPIQPLRAAPLPTSTTLLSDTGVVGTNDPPQFTVLVYAGVDPVPVGPVLITHLNTSQTDVVNIVNGATTTIWPWSISTAGTHVFQADFQGFPGYLASTGSGVVIVEDISPGSQQTPLLDLTANTSLVHKNDDIRFTLTLTINENWYFDGGYLSTTNTNLSGTPTIHTYGPLAFYYPDTNPTVFTYTFDYQIPDFAPVGFNFFMANYTGSGPSGTAPAISPPLAVQVESDGFSLIQQINQTTIQRVGDTLELNTTVVGDYPVGLPLETYYFDGGQRVSVNKTVLTSRNLVTTFSPNSSVSLGSLSLFTILTDISGTIVYDNITQNLDIVDNARIDPTTNTTLYLHNETIEFSVYVTEEDVWTRPIIADVELLDVTDGNRSLENKSTDGNGFVLFTHRIPSNATVGTHKYGLRTFNTPSEIVDQLEIVTVTLKGVTIIDLDYGTGVVDRGTFTTITTTVLSGGVALTEGQIALEFANGTAIETQNVAPGLDFFYFIDQTQILGVSPYQVHYLGSPNFTAHIEPFDLTVFSSPTFNTTGRNASEVVKSQTLRLWGVLLDEVWNPVYFEEVRLTDTTTGVFLGTTQTDIDGIFTFDYFISPSTQIGLHFVEVRYDGNITRFYRAATNTPIISFTVRPPLSVMIATEVVAENWTLITLGGGLNDWVDLSWQKIGETSWTSIGSVQLNGTGQGTFNWGTPYYKGVFTLRAQGPSDTKYDSSTMWVIPDLTVTGSGVGSVNDQYLFTVNASERYQIWIEGLLWQDWVSGGGGPTPYSYTFTSRGAKDIMVRSNDTYVYLRESQNLITIYEDVFVSLTVPTTTAINVTVHLDGLLLGEVTGLLTAYDAVLYVNDTAIEVDVTNGAGRFDFYIALSQPGMYALQIQAPSTGYYQEAWSLIAYLEVKPEPPSVNIVSPADTTTQGAIVPITLDGNAQSYWYYLEGLDPTNITWTGTIYRSLLEGDYTLHAYGENQWNLMTHIISDFTVDTTAPSLGIVSPINTSYTTADVPFVFLTDGINVTVWVDGGVLTAPYLATLPGLSEGSHVLKISADDGVGNQVTQQVSFTVDTIPPSLQIDTPYNQSYTGEFNVSISSDGDTVLYHIVGNQTTNQTYTMPVSHNLSVGRYQLVVYAFDTAGNSVQQTVDFSIVPSINLLVDPRLVEVDGAGNYYIHTLLQSNPNFESVGLWQNGLYVGDLSWDIFAQNYSLAFQLSTPGIWGITLYARTTLGAYDMRHYTINWNPPAPSVTFFDLDWKSSYYEVRVEVDTVGLPIDQVTIEMDGKTYPLFYQTLWNRYEGHIYIVPQNLSAILAVWYPWDTGTPSHSSTHLTAWFAPSIQVEIFQTNRLNFTLTILVNKQNASIDSSQIYLVLYNATASVNVSGTLVFEGLGGNYQRWTFHSPLLARIFWSYEVMVHDIHGARGVLHGVFNATDAPPVIGNSTIRQVDFQEKGGNIQVQVDVTDDYEVMMVVFEFNGEQYTARQDGNTFHFTVWLSAGTYSIRIIATDDIGQEMIVNIDSFLVQGESGNIVSTTTPSESGNPSGSDSTGDGNLLFDYTMIAGILGLVITTGNFVVNKRKGRSA